MKNALILIAFMPFIAYGQTFTSPIGAATSQTKISGLQVEQFVNASVVAMNRPGGQARYAQNVLKSFLGKDKLPSGTRTINITTNQYQKLFSKTGSDKSLWLRSAVDPIVWDLENDVRGEVSADAYPAAVVSATYVVKNPLKIERFLEKANYRLRVNEFKLELKENW